MGTVIRGGEEERKREKKQSQERDGNTGIATEQKGPMNRAGERRRWIRTTE